MSWNVLNIHVHPDLKLEPDLSEIHVPFTLSSASCLVAGSSAAGPSTRRILNVPRSGLTGPDRAWPKPVCLTLLHIDVRNLSVSALCTCLQNRMECKLWLLSWLFRLKLLIEDVGDLDRISTPMWNVTAQPGVSSDSATGCSFTTCLFLALQHCGTLGSSAEPDAFSWCGCGPVAGSSLL